MTDMNEDRAESGALALLMEAALRQTSGDARCVRLVRDAHPFLNAACLSWGVEIDPGPEEPVTPEDAGEQAHEFEETAPRFTCESCGSEPIGYADANRCPGCECVICSPCVDAFDHSRGGAHGKGDRGAEFEKLRAVADAARKLPWFRDSFYKGGLRFGGAGSYGAAQFLTPETEALRAALDELGEEQCPANT